MVNLCADKMNHPKYRRVATELAAAGIHQQILVASDTRNFDIMKAHLCSLRGLRGDRDLLRWLAWASTRSRRRSIKAGSHSSKLWSQRPWGADPLLWRSESKRCPGRAVLGGQAGDVTGEMLSLRCKVPLFAAVKQTIAQRGAVLSNQSFRKQLVQFCFRENLDLEGEGSNYTIISDYI